MLLTINTTHNPATDLGYLLHKHPDKVQSFKLNFGQRHVFYPDVAPQRAGTHFPLQPYVNDRPYVASSFLSVAITQIFGTALNGRCKDRPQLVEQFYPWKPRCPPCPAAAAKTRCASSLSPAATPSTPSASRWTKTFPSGGAAISFQYG